MVSLICEWLHFTLKSKYHHFCIFLESPAWFLRNLCKAQCVPISFINRARFTTELLALQYMSMWSYFKVTHKILGFTFPNFQMKQCNCSILPKKNYKIKTNQPVEALSPVMSDTQIHICRHIDVHNVLYLSIYLSNLFNVSHFVFLFVPGN